MFVNSKYWKINIAKSCKRKRYSECLLANLQYGLQNSFVCMQFWLINFYMAGEKKRQKEKENKVAL